MGRRPTPGHCLATTAALATALAVAGCSTAGQSPGAEVSGAGTVTGPSTPAPTSSATVPVPVALTPTTGPFDCSAVAAAQRSLAEHIDDALTDLDVPINSPEAYAVTLVVTARGSPQYWRTALTAVPADVAEPAASVLEHWIGLEPELATIHLDSASADDLQSARDRVMMLTAAADKVAADERTVSHRIDRDCALR
jgi:hypothetical protein